ncbi:MAG: FliI/YscN family ATPase [Candidatus Scalindua sp. AMX11]|nr:MAG: FliI/YscN family ATPase [Candidatus Scalindua sp.]NOG85775.1 FliI/YscN family ATPase [Planctomycetota bacterium]RZV97049.1 MAG: FliI/YscN family ATPase [Candidatus Scalindua sp. SCAELEC01]TDE66337.1 MAG: FliI/YscN family ATPase [Candidatus Scalindua sp. AMX11]GJQ58271.1 MAG: EscN/YscN/HrcN family type III secretion system ATPase [Candidatus Scalindua sp.]
MKNKKGFLGRHFQRLSSIDTIKYVGTVSRATSMLIESLGPEASVGELCSMTTQSKKKTVLAEVVGFKDTRTLLMPIGDTDGISPKSEVVATGLPLQIKVGSSLIGRILDGLGNPIDNKGPVKSDEMRPVYNEPPDPLSRQLITEPISTGIRAIDGLLTCGKGQRLGIFAGSGVGKSTLLGKIATSSKADVNVIALIGERGREVREFIEHNLGEEGLKKSVVIVVTSDKPVIVRLKGGFVATTIAECLRDKGMDVMLMMDSVTRLANAQREIGLSIGEPPTSRGYTPSVFSLLPKLLERPGATKVGSITALYTVLVEGDDFNEPVSDTVRGILDGHIILSRKIAAQNHYPAIDILNSVSRCMIDVVSSAHMMAAQKMRATYSIYKDAEDMINVGAYVEGRNPKIDYAVNMFELITGYLQQGVGEQSSFPEDILKLQEMMSSTVGKVQDLANRNN